MKTNEDKRVIRSKKAITEALLDLIEETPYHKITVDDILQKSGYSRTAFYAHFEGKDQCMIAVIDSFCDDYVKGALNAIENANEITDVNSIYLSNIFMWQWLSKQKHFLLNIFCMKEYKWMQYLQKTLYRKMLDNIQFNIRTPNDLKNNLNIDFYMRVRVDMNLSIIRYWVEQKFEYTPEMIAQQVLLFFGIKDANELMRKQE